MILLFEDSSIPSLQRISGDQLYQAIKSASSVMFAACLWMPFTILQNELQPLAEVSYHCSTLVQIMLKMPHLMSKWPRSLLVVWQNTRVSLCCNPCFPRGSAVQHLFQIGSHINILQLRDAQAFRMTQAYWDSMATKKKGFIDSSGCVFSRWIPAPRPGTDTWRSMSTLWVPPARSELA